MTRHSPIHSEGTGRAARVDSPRRAHAAFTLVELSVSIGIIAILISISGFAFTRIAEGNVLAQAENAVLVYARLARSYAMANQIETMMVVNPFNGRFEIWHVSPPAASGTWNPLSDGTGARPTDGYRFAPILDSGARLPVDADGKPMAVVHPIDFADLSTIAAPQPALSYRPLSTDPDDRNIDNLAWAAFCFDANGRLIIRTRRIATRTYTRRNGAQRPADAPGTPPDARVGPNRLIDETPDIAADPNYPTLPRGTVNVNDTPITSTRGFIISDLTRVRTVAPAYDRDPQKLVDDWLIQTLPGRTYARFARKVVLNRITGQDLVNAS